MQDNISIWAVIRHVAHGGPGWSWVSRFACTSNGRVAYTAMKGHYLEKHTLPVFMCRRIRYSRMHSMMVIQGPSPIKGTVRL